MDAKRKTKQEYLFSFLCIDLVFLASLAARLSWVWQCRWSGEQLYFGGDISIVHSIVTVLMYARLIYGKGVMKERINMPRPSSGTSLSLADLQQIMEDRRSDLNRLRKQRTKAQRELDQIDKQIAKIEGAGGRRGGGNGRVRNEMSLNDTLEQVLRKAGKPLPVGDIVEAVQATGYRTNSANFRGIVNQTLIKDARFAATERGIYGLKK